MSELSFGPNGYSTLSPEEASKLDAVSELINVFNVEYRDVAVDPTSSSESDLRYRFDMEDLAEFAVDVLRRAGGRLADEAIQTAITKEENVRAAATGALSTETRLASERVAKVISLIKIGSILAESDSDEHMYEVQINIPSTEQHETVRYNKFGKFMFSGRFDNIDAEE